MGVVEKARISKNLGKRFPSILVKYEALKLNPMYKTAIKRKSPFVNHVILLHDFTFLDFTISQYLRRFPLVFSIFNPRINIFGFGQLVVFWSRMIFVKNSL